MQFLDAVDSDETMPSPALVILDINLPRRNGFEVLEHLRRSRRCRAASVIVVSTSNAAADRERALHSGGDAFFRKPSEYDAFMQLGSLIRKLFQGRAR